MASDEPAADSSNPVSESSPGPTGAESPATQQPDAAPSDEPMFKPPEMEAVVASLRPPRDRS